jgi:hypothetical protein
MTRPLPVLLVLALAIPITARPASAQISGASVSRHVAFDTVMGYQDFFREERDWPAQLLVDAYFAVEPRPRWQVSFRPKVWRTQGDWEVMVDQASVRREFRKGSNWRIEAGKFPSIIGYGVMENRPNLNAGVLWWHRPYYMPLPSLGPTMPVVSLVSTTYPWGVQVGTSATHWDARGAIVDRAPVEFWRGDDRASRRPHGVVGGGLTPLPGMRIGAGAAWGQLVRGERHSGYRMLNIEGELAVGYSKVSGEWTTDHFDARGLDATASGWTLQLQHTLTPQLFAHTRVTAIRSSSALGSDTRRTYRSIDTTIGYRLDPELTLRVAHTAIRSWTVPDIDHQIGVSLMWARRWW